MILYVENLNDSIEKDCQSLSMNSAVAGYKNQTQSVVFLQTNNEQPKKESMKTIPFTIASERVKYFRINFIKEVKETQIVKTTNHC